MKPILFNTEMVQAIMEGRKTVTRRLIKPQPGENAKMMYTFAGSHKSDIGKWSDQNDKNSHKLAPPFHADDILYVRETWAKMADLGTISEAGYVYRADFNTCELLAMDTKHFRWKPSIHMPKEAARIFLKVKSVRVERLQDITDEEAIKEGCTGVPCYHPGKDEHGCVDCFNTGWVEPPCLDFMYLWDSTIKKADLPTYGWDANPWVWVIEFERCEKPQEVDEYV